MYSVIAFWCEREKMIHRFALVSQNIFKRFPGR